MGLIVKYLGQPFPGREITVDESKDKVQFGRGMDCDVSFPEDMAIVSRNHFMLRKELGGYKFVINKEKPVFMNGRPVYDDQDLPRSAEIQLSGPTGPRLKLERTDAASGNMVRTEILKPQENLVDTMGKTQASGQRTARIVALVVAIVAVLGAAGWFISQRLSTDVAQVTTEVAEVKKAIVAIQGEMPSIKDQLSGIKGGGGKALDAAAIIEKNKESVYIVSVLYPSGSRDGMGTASVVRLPDGRKALATNSHVADLFNEIANEPSMKGAKLVVTQPKGPDYSTLEVVTIDKHPGYDAFNAWADAFYGKVEAKAAQNITFIPAFDVALLYVAEPEKLGEPLTYASRETMLNLKAGQPLILIGYPGEMLKGTDVMQPEPTSQTGIITAATTYFLSRGAAEDDLLIQHSVPATGGASGSPMFNDKGEVVAFLNAGNITMVKDAEGNSIRIPNSALVNYAQRADMLIDLAEGKAAGKMPGYLKQMAEAEKRFTKTADAFIADMVMMFGAALGNPGSVARVMEQDLVMDKPIPELDGRRAAVLELNVAETGIYMFLANSPESRNIAVVALEKDGRMINSGPGAANSSWTFADRSQTGPILLVVIDMSGEDPKNDTRPAGKAKLVIYRGEQGSGS